VGPRAGLDFMEYRIIFSPTGNRIPAVQPVAIPTELSRPTQNISTETKDVHNRNTDANLREPTRRFQLHILENASKCPPLSTYV
jgi:hypothetical protein